MNDSWAAISTMAGKALIARPAGQTEAHRYAFDRALRVARTVERLASRVRPEERPTRVDLARVAALYSCVGCLRPADTSRGATVEDGAELAADQLPTCLPNEDVDVVVRILGEYRSRGTRMAEARLLSDAVGLEDVGLVGLWNLTRSFHGAGKTLEQFVRLWKAQAEYGYWETRLREDFHFEASRKVVRQRLSQLQAVFERLGREMLAEDI